MSATSPPRPKGSRKFIVLAAAGAFLDGYDIAIIAVAILLLVPAFDLGTGMTGLVVASQFIGMILGSLVFGSVADRVGRKKVFIADMILFIVAALVTALAPTLAVLIIGRVLTGIAIGMEYPAATAVIVELASEKRRGGSAMIMQTAGFSGNLAAIIVGLVLYNTGNPDAWRWLFATAMIPAIIVFLLRSGTPESPFWKASAQKPSSQGSASLGRHSDLFTRRYRTPTAFICAYWFLGNVTGASLLLYAPTLATTGFGLEGARSLYLAGGLNALYMVGNLVVAVLLVDRFGRRAFALVAWGSALGLTVMLTVTLGPSLWLTAALFALATLVLQAAIMGPAFPLSVEMFPTRLRATGQGVATAAGKLGALLGTLFLPRLLDALGLQGVFAGVAVALAIGLVLVITIGPRQRKSLAEVDNEEAADQLAAASIGLTTREGRL